MFVTPPTFEVEALVPVVERLSVVGTAGALLVRMPTATVQAQLETGRRLKSVAGSLAFFVHGRLELALALDAHLHLPVDAPAARDVRPHLTPGTWISASVHDEAELERRAPDADFVLLSPVFAPGSKPDDARSPLGADGFRALAARAPCPAFALGGMTPERTRDVAPAGVAALNPWWDGRALAEVEQLAKAFLEALSEKPAGL